MEIQAIRQVRPVDQRPVPSSGHPGRRHRLHSLDVRRFAHSRLGPADDELRPAAERLPLPRLLGHLRPGHRKPKPAGPRGHARSNRRPDQRGQELVERLHAGLVSSDHSEVERPGDLRSGLAQGHDPRDAAQTARHARRVQRRTPKTAHRQQRSGRADRQL